MNGTVAQAALLTVSALVDMAESSEVDSPLVPITAAAIAELAVSLADRHGRSWAKEYVGRPDRLAEDVEELLLDAGLVVRQEDGALQIRAIAARYAPEPFDTIETQSQRLESPSLEAP